MMAAAAVYVRIRKLYAACWPVTSPTPTWRGHYFKFGLSKRTSFYLQSEIAKRDSKFNKPLYILEQQSVGTEADLLSLAIKKTFAGLVQANENVRRPAPLSKITIGFGMWWFRWFFGDIS
jgi:hypothetical protein